MVGTRLAANMVRRNVCRFCSSGQQVLLILHSAHLASAKDEQHELDVLGERLAVVPVAVLLVRAEG